MLPAEEVLSRKSFYLLLVTAVLALGCSGKPKAPANYDRAMKWSGVGGAQAPPTDHAYSYMAKLPLMGRSAEGVVLAAPRFVAVRHRLEIVEAGAGLPKSIEAVVAFCGTIQCEVLSSSVTSETAGLSPSGNIAARVAPQDLNKFLEFVEKQGSVAQHGTESEDKTAAIVDVEAKLKNQTDFRDSLRKMLTKSGVSVADLLQIQEKLAEAQAELDSEATQRKILANETEKVFVEIAFRSERQTTGRGAFAAVSEALRDFGSVLGDSLAALITVVAAIVPWSIVIIPGLWFLIRSVRRIRERRRAAKAVTSSE
jgi:Domain of unknown function (DUF4349)